MNDTGKLSQQLYDTALDELNTYLEDLKTKPPQRSSAAPIRSYASRIS